MQLSEILPGQLYVRADIRRMKLENLVPVLRAQGVNLVVGVSWKKHPELEDVIEYWHRPFPDGKLTPERLRHVNSIVTELVSRIRGGAIALIHCRGGKNRSGLIAALTAARLLKIDTAEALELVQRIRPQAFETNKHYVEYLKGADDAG